MFPTSVALSNYRCFGGSEPTTFELRPITLLYGRNGGGKSALIRSLPLIADSLAPDHEKLDALNLEGRLRDFDLDFESIRWKGRKETDAPTISLGLRWEGDDLLHEVDWVIDEQEESHRTVTTIMNIMGREELFLDWQMRREEATERALSYRFGPPDLEYADIKKLEFRGLLPPALGETPTFRALDERLRWFANSVLWLHSLRPAPARFKRWKGAVRWSLDYDGHDAPIVLAGEPAVLQEVSSFYEKHLNLELVVKESRKREVRTVIRGKSLATFDVDLIDTGEGLSEVLPVLTALAMVRRHKERGGPSILAIEEPGSHLHPDLQLALMGRVCEVAKEAKPRIVLETHSELALLAIQRAVVQGIIAPEDVIFYWVDQNPTDGRSTLQKIELNRAGRLQGNWPPDAFQQDILLAADLQDARDELEGRR